MGRPRKYTAKRLEEEVAAYFASITRTVTVKEKVDTGKKDKMGHIIWDYVPIVNDAGKEIRQLEFVLPPTIGDLCDYLKIDPSTWTEYCDPEKHPEFSKTTKRARGRVFAYLQGETLVRPDKMLKGILFNIENNFPEYAECVAMGRREQALRIQKLEAELKILQDGQRKEEQEESGLVDALRGAAVSQTMQDDSDLLPEETEGEAGGV